MAAGSDEDYTGREVACNGAQGEPLGTALLLEQASVCAVVRVSAARTAWHDATGKPTRDHIARSCCWFNNFVCNPLGLGAAEPAGCE